MLFRKFDSELRTNQFKTAAGVSMAAFLFEGRRDQFFHRVPFGPTAAGA